MQERKFVYQRGSYGSEIEWAREDLSLIIGLATLTFWALLLSKVPKYWAHPISTSLLCTQFQL